MQGKEILPYRTHPGVFPLGKTAEVGPGLSMAIDTGFAVIVYGDLQLVRGIPVFAPAFHWLNDIRAESYAKSGGRFWDRVQRSSGECRIMASVRVLHVITGLNVGGAEMMLYRLLCALDRRRFVPGVVSLTTAGTVAKMIEKDLNIPVRSLHMKKGVLAFRGINELQRVVQSWTPDIIHSHMIHANLAARMVRIFNRKPVLICSAYNCDERGSKEHGRWRERAYRLSDPLCHLTTQVSEAGLERYVRIGAVPADKIAHVPVGIDLERSQAGPKEAEALRKRLAPGANLVFLAVGSLTPQKNYHNLLNAFAAVRENNPDAVLLIAGDGPQRHALMEYVRNLGLTQSVSFLGLRKDVPVLMKSADIFVMSSAWEGLPMVLLEAAAAGLPLIATDVGGNRELVLHRENGFLVPSQDSNALARTMERMIDMGEAERRKMGASSHRLLTERYSMDMVASLWQELYFSLIKKAWKGKGDYLAVRSHHEDLFYGQ